MRLVNRSAPRVSLAKWVLPVAQSGRHRLSEDGGEGEPAREDELRFPG